MIVQFQMLCADTIGTREIGDVCGADTIGTREIGDVCVRLSQKTLGVSTMRRATR
jgi:hypothetical protein